MTIIWKENGTFNESGTERGESLWIQEKFRYGDVDKELDRKQRPSLQGNIKTEVAVIGAGLAGVLTAYMLQQRGLSVVVVECQEVGSGMTKNTTAKITSQHGLIYHKLITQKGEDFAKAYAKANQEALEQFDALIYQLQIECDYVKLPNYIYTLKEEQKIKQEVEAAKRVGIPATYTKDLALPLRVKAAIRTEKQAQFHPLKFLDVIAKHLTIYEHTRVTEIHEEGLIKTDQGNIAAKVIVVATHYPFINVPGYYFFKLHQERFYLSALEGCKMEKLEAQDGMYLDADPNGFTFRNYKDFIILGSGGHRTGKHNPIDAYARIEDAARRWYPEAKIAYRWSNQDCMTPDGVPYIGRYSVKTPNIYVATGFNKWGMSSAMVAARIIADQITDKRNPYQKVFNPFRSKVSGSKIFAQDVGTITTSLLSEHLKITRDDLGQIAQGKAGVIKYNGERVGVYRDKQDNYYFVSTKCPHLGCALEWNQNELTWDCPCHGSRFDYKGKLINNPAMRDTFDACQRKKKQSETE